MIGTPLRRPAVRAAAAEDERECQEESDRARQRGRNGSAAEVGAAGRRPSRPSCRRTGLQQARPLRLVGGRVIVHCGPVRRRIEAAHRQRGCRARPSAPGAHAFRRGGDGSRARRRCRAPGRAAASARSSPQPAGRRCVARASPAGATSSRAVGAGTEATVARRGATTRAAGAGDASTSTGAAGEAPEAGLDAGSGGAPARSERRRRHGHDSRGGVEAGAGAGPGAGAGSEVEQRPAAGSSDSGSR